MMTIPWGAVRPGQKGKVCCLLKGLYGLKQAGRGWHQELTRVFTRELTFTKSDLDHSIFYHKTLNEHMVVAVVTNDMVVASKHLKHVEKMKEGLKWYWEITDMGEIKWYLCFKVKHGQTAHTISINQCAYIETIVSKFKVITAKLVAILMDPGMMLSNNQGPVSMHQTLRM